MMNHLLSQIKIKRRIQKYLKINKNGTEKSKFTQNRVVNNKFDKINKFCEIFRNINFHNLEMTKINVSIKFDLNFVSF